MFVLVAIAAYYVSGWGFSAGAAQIQGMGVDNAASVTAPTQTTEAVYPSSQIAQDFNDDTATTDGTFRDALDPLRSSYLEGGDWYGYQEFSALCFVRGVTCPKWDSIYMNGVDAPAEGPIDPVEGPLPEPRLRGASGEVGDGFIRTHGTSLAVAPCTPQVGNARWDGPLWTYDSPGAQGWRIQLDLRQSYLLLGEGHGGWGIDIVDENGRVATSAVPVQLTVPDNQWRHVDLAFDGSRLERGKQYRISLKVLVLHGETAASWGDMDFDNVRLVTTSEPQPFQNTNCDPNPGDDLVEGIRTLLQGLPGLSEEPGSACGITEALGNSAAPILDPFIDLANTPAISGMLDRGDGAFGVVDYTTGQATTWLTGANGLPPSDPREIFVYIRDGSMGNFPDTVFFFVTYTLGSVQMLGEDPAGSIQGILEGQVGNVQQIVNDPVGELADTDPLFTAESIKFLVENALGPLQDPQPQVQSLGGTVWQDPDLDGIRQPGDEPVSGLPVTLYDCDDEDVVGTTETAPDGTYQFTGIDPTFAPEGYCVDFDATGQGPGTVFSQPWAPGSTAANDSNVVSSAGDPPIGRSNLVFIDPGEEDLTIDAGIAPQQVEPNEPGQLVNSGDPSLCLEAESGDVATLQECDPEPVPLQQFWTYTTASTLEVTSPGGDPVCLDTGEDTAGPLPEDSPVVLAACDGTPSQQWTPGPNSTVISASSGMCLGVVSDSAVNGAVAVLRTCTDVLAQQWTIVPVLGVPLGDWGVALLTVGVGVALLSGAALLRRRRRSAMA